MKSWKQYRSELLNEEAKQSSDQSAIEDFVGYIKNSVWKTFAHIFGGFTTASRFFASGTPSPVPKAILLFAN